MHSPPSALTTLRSIHRFAILLLCGAGVLGLGCVQEKPVPPPQRAPAAKVARPRPPLRDLAGQARDPGRGITPGALEAEGPPPKDKRPPSPKDKQRE